MALTVHGQHGLGLKVGVCTGTLTGACLLSCASCACSSKMTFQELNYQHSVLAESRNRLFDYICWKSSPQPTLVSQPTAKPSEEGEIAGEGRHYVALPNTHLTSWQQLVACPWSGKTPELCCTRLAPDCHCIPTGTTLPGQCMSHCWAHAD